MRKDIIFQHFETLLYLLIIKIYIILKDLNISLSDQKKNVKLEANVRNFKKINSKRRPSNRLYLSLCRTFKEN